jgi:hypothetical protein
MARWFRNSAEPRESRLKRLLADYPPYRIPHRGPGRRLSLAQAEANLAYLLDHKEERLAIVSALLTQFGLDAAAGLSADDPRPFLDGLWRWSCAEWPAVHDPAFMPIDVWLNSSREGPEIIFSMLMDVGILLGELVLVQRSDYHWVLDLDQQNAAEMVSWQRPVLLRPADNVVPVIFFDLEDTARTSYVRCTGTPYRMLNDLGREVLDAISGAHEVAWREQIEGPSS